MKKPHTNCQTWCWRDDDLGSLCSQWTWALQFGVIKLSTKSLYNQVFKTQM